MPPRRALLIMNPKAGDGARSDVVMQLAAARSQWLTVRQTTHQGHATALARNAVAEDIAMVVAAGGDGLVSEVVEGLASDFTAATLAILPIGTANDFARTMGISFEPDEAFALIDHGSEQTVDVIRATGSNGTLIGHVLNMATGGFAVELGRQLDDDTKKRWGRLSYLVAGLRLLVDPPVHQVTLTLDGRTSETSTPAVLIANGPAAGGMSVVPEAQPTDAAMDVATILADGLSDKAALAARFIAGTHLDSQFMDHRRARTVRVNADPPMAFHADGEPLGTTPLTFELLPRVLRMILPTPIHTPA